MRGARPLAAFAIALGGAAAMASPPLETDCSAWSLDGYRLGMSRDGVLAVRSITLHVEGQAQAVEPGRFSGVLVLEPSFGLAKWDVAYTTTDATALRTEFLERFGTPVADVTGDAIRTETESLRQRRTIWIGPACDAAILLYEYVGATNAPAGSVRASLVRASSLSPALLKSRTLYP